MPVQFPICMEYRPPLRRRDSPVDLRDHHSTKEGICQKKTGGEKTGNAIRKFNFKLYIHF